MTAGAYCLEPVETLNPAAMTGLRRIYEEGLPPHQRADFAGVTVRRQEGELAVALVADMEQVRRELAHRAFGPQLRHDEAVEKPAQQVAVAKDGAGIRAKQRADECGVDQVSLR